MMYQNKFVVAVKVNGKVLREDGNTVNLPFGSEYSILLKNLNSVRALANISIDGQDVTDGTKLIIPANGNFDIERYIRNGNFNSGNKFKFIERTEAIENHRGIKEDDGLIRVEFWPEKVSVVKTLYYDEYIPVKRYYDPYYHPYYYPHWTVYSSTTNSRGYLNNQYQQNTNSIYSNSQCSNLPTMDSIESEVSDTGITVAGSESNQQFHSGSWFATEAQSEVIVLQLKGLSNGQAIKQPITVQYKPKCNTCGRKNKTSSKFCPQCGTATVMI